MVKLHRVDEWLRLPLGGVRRLLGVARRECRHGGALEKCAQSMRTATGQDVEIMLGVDGTDYLTGCFSYFPAFSIYELR